MSKTTDVIMLRLLRPFCWLALFTALTAKGATAQAIPLAQLSDHVTQGAAITVIELGGQRTKGRLVEHTRDSLTLLANDRERRTFPAPIVRRILVQDSSLNGLLIGLGVAFFPAVFAAAEASPGISLGPSNGSAGNGALAFVGVLVLGAVVGASVDAAIERAVDISPSQASRLTVSPTISVDRQTVLVSVRF